MRSEEFFASKAAEPSAMTSRAKNVWRVTSRPSISVRSCKPCSTVTDTRGQAVCRFLGDISYPLYVTHYPLIYFQMSFAASHPDLPASTKIAFSVSLFVLAIFVAYASLKLYDLPVREWLKRKLF